MLFRSAIFFLLALFLAPPIKNYFVQRAQISALQSQLDSDRSALAAARRELLLWQDPEYIKTQARERLHFVLPGERQYIVVGVETQESSAEKKRTPIATKQFGSAPWYTKLISSIQQVAAGSEAPSE